jgi:hypothetical protein
MMTNSRAIGVAILLSALPLGPAFAQSAPLYVPAPVEASPAAATPAPVAPPTEKSAKQISADKSSELVCRRRLETGSLVKAKKTCLTREQWAYLDAEHQRMGRDFVVNNMGRPSGN